MYILMKILKRAKVAKLQMIKLYTVAFRNFLLLTDWSATHSKNLIFIAQKTLRTVWTFPIFFYFVRWKSQIKKILDTFIYWGKYKQTSSLLLLATVGLKFSSSNLSPSFTSIMGALRSVNNNVSRDLQFCSYFIYWTRYFAKWIIT